MRRLFAALGVDYAQWKALTVAALKLDLRAGGAAVAQMTQQRRTGTRAMVGQLFFYGGLGIFMAAAVAFLGDPFVAAMLVVSYIIVMVGTTMLLDLNGVILSPTDYGILGFQPITSRTYFAAKLTNVLVYTLALTTLVGLPPALALLVKHGAAVGFAALAAVYVCALSVTLAIIAGYATLVRAVGARRLRSVLSWVQMGISVVVYGGYFVVGDLIEGSALAGFTLPWSPWLLLYPGTWFASYVELAAGRTDALQLFAALASLALIALLGRSMRGRLSLQYAEQLGVLTTRSTAAESRAAPLRRLLWFRGGEARAVAILVRSQFRNDMKFRMGVLAIIPMTLIYLVMGLNEARESNSLTPDLTFVTMAVLLFPTMLKTSLSSSDAFRASWIFFATPAQRTRLIESSRKLLLVFFLLPYLAVVGAVLAFLTGRFTWILVYVALVALLSNLVLLAATLMDPALPFARPQEKMKGTTQFMLIMIVIGFTAVFLRMFTRLLDGNAAAIAAAFGVVIAVSAVVHRLTRARIERQAARLEFEG